MHLQFLQCFLFAKLKNIFGENEIIMGKMTQALKTGLTSSSPIPGQTSTQTLRCQNWKLEIHKFLASSTWCLWGSLLKFSTVCRLCMLPLTRSLARPQALCLPLTLPLALPLTRSPGASCKVSSHCSCLIKSGQSDHLTLGTRALSQRIFLTHYVTPSIWSESLETYSLKFSIVNFTIWPLLVT